MTHDSYYLGMYAIWWLIWLGFLLWIFVLPFAIPNQRSTRQSPLEMLRKRIAAGQVTKEEYHDRKKILEADPVKR